MPADATPSLDREKLSLDVLRAVTKRPNLTQRQLAELLGVSLGKTNFVIQAVLKRGWIKVENFKQSNNKLGYAYILTPQGINERLRLTRTFIQLKEDEYELLRRDIDQLKHEVNHLPT